MEGVDPFMLQLCTSYSIIYRHFMYVASLYEYMYYRANRVGKDGLLGVHGHTNERQNLPMAGTQEWWHQFPSSSTD